MNDNVCPTCGSSEYVAINMSSSAEYAWLIYVGHGAARLRGCLDCGTVYIDKYDRKIIKDRLINNARKRRTRKVWTGVGGV